MRVTAIKRLTFGALLISIFETIIQKALFNSVLLLFCSFNIFCVLYSVFVEYFRHLFSNSCLISWYIGCRKTKKWTKSSCGRVAVFTLYCHITAMAILSIISRLKAIHSLKGKIFSGIWFAISEIWLLFATSRTL